MSAENPELQSQTAMKLATAKQKKDTADQAFKEGNVKAGEDPWLSGFRLLTHCSFNVIS
jgi:hypothetical protein